MAEKKKMNIPLRIAKIPNNFFYSIEHGDQSHLSDMTNHTSQGPISARNIESKNRDFFGHCYNCGCLRHSQNYCPLKLCSICAKYGHDKRVCFFNPSRKIWSNVSQSSSVAACALTSHDGKTQKTNDMEENNAVAN